MSLCTEAQKPVWPSPAFLAAVAASFLAHILGLTLLMEGHATGRPESRPAPLPMEVTLLSILQPEEAPAPVHPEPAPPVPAQQRVAEEPPAHNAATLAAPAKAQQAQQPASMEAPPPPSAEEWSLAAGYTLKNSKRYRYAWGQQVRSMMGTAVEGPQQGDVRFRVEIAPDGHLVRLDTLWSTSDTAERLAREAMGRMPPLPPTPTGKPLVFEKTISFQPHDTGWPPIYKYDCLPDPPGFHNPFAWDGSGSSSASAKEAPDASESAAAAVDENCINSLPADSVEAVGASVERQFKTWGSLPLNGVK